MYERILVPLDGSAFAEQALCHVEQVALPGTAEIHLLSVAPLLEDHTLAVVDLYPIYVYRDYIVDQDQEAQRVQQELQGYLDHVAERLVALGYRMERNIRFGQPAEEIIAYADDVKCDLIVMSTHGRSGVGRWVYGSVADKVLRGSNIPILLIRTKDTRD